MRPLALRMSGLRSYRSEVTIDFGDPGLIAIVGDTGAGKSSILEALFFVLYGGCTWGHPAAGAPLSRSGPPTPAGQGLLAASPPARGFPSGSPPHPHTRTAPAGP